MAYCCYPYAERCVRPDAILLAVYFVLCQFCFRKPTFRQVPCSILQRSFLSFSTFLGTPHFSTSYFFHTVYSGFLPLYSGTRPCPICSRSNAISDPSGHHASVRRTGPGIVRRHNALREQPILAVRNVARKYLVHVFREYSFPGSPLPVSGSVPSPPHNQRPLHSA